MKKLYLIVISLSCFCVINDSFCQFSGSDEDGNKISGFVFNDSNKNRKFDGYEKGIPGVLVSNGVDVVESDMNGKYSLDLLDDDNMIFVIKPSGWNVPLNVNNLPQFFHSLLSEETEASQFPGLKSEQVLSGYFDFPLYKAAEKDTFEFIALADPQARKLIELYYLRDDVVSELIYSQAAFGITLGDIMYDNLTLFDRHNEIVGKIGIPFYNVPGNHDIDQSATEDNDALQTFSKIYGPAYYAFEYGKANFIVLDDVEWRGDSETSKGSYRGFIGETQLEWMKNYLRFVPAGHLVIIALHIPLYYSGSTDNVVNVDDRNDLFNILNRYDNVLVIAGHMHIIEHVFLDDELGWKGKKVLHQITCAAASGSWWTGPKDERDIPESMQRDGTPNGYHIFKITGNRYKEYFKPAGNSKDFQMRIDYPDEMLCRAELDTMKIIVNICMAIPGPAKESILWKRSLGILAFQKQESKFITFPRTWRVSFIAK